MDVRFSCPGMVSDVVVAARRGAQRVTDDATTVEDSESFCVRRDMPEEVDDGCDYIGSAIYCSPYAVWVLPGVVEELWLGGRTGRRGDGRTTADGNAETDLPRCVVRSCVRDGLYLRRACTIELGYGMGVLGCTAVKRVDGSRSGGLMA